MRLRILSVLVLLWGTSLHADSAGERAALIRLAHEIEALKSLADAASHQTNYPQRVRFQYGWLKQDLDKVRQGILEHLNAPESEPRRITPLAGDYRR
jgi:RAQPRD family integrative conjugative element protein